jgi:hypothetical protein
MFKFYVKYIIISFNLMLIVSKMLINFNIEDKNDEIFPDKVDMV